MTQCDQVAKESRRLTLRELLLSVSLTAIGFGLVRLPFSRDDWPVPLLRDLGFLGECIGVAIVFFGWFALSAGAAIPVARLLMRSRSTNWKLAAVGGLIGACGWFLLLCVVYSIVASQYRQ